MPKPFANSPQYLNNISEDFLIPIQTGNLTDASGLSQMKYVKFSQLSEYIRNNFTNLGHFRGACTELPDNLAANDFFYCKTSFVEDGDSFVAGKYYQIDVDDNWSEISLVFDGLLTEADIVDDLITQASDKPLSANMGYEMEQQIQNLLSEGRYLSLWNCTTGMPTTNPPTGVPYAYKNGDYYMVSTVGGIGVTNYKPNGSSYTGAASTTVESAEVMVNDFYRFDGTNWSLLHNTQKTVSFGQIAGNPSDNLALASALGAKADVTAMNKIVSSAAVSDYSSSQAYSVGDKCKKDGVAYVCNTAIASPGEAWDSAHWDEASTVANRTAISDLIAYPLLATISTDHQVFKLTGKHLYILALFHEAIIINTFVVPSLCLSNMSIKYFYDDGSFIVWAYNSTTGEWDRYGTAPSPSLTSVRVYGI